MENDFSVQLFAINLTLILYEHIAFAVLLWTECAVTSGGCFPANIIMHVHCDCRPVDVDITKALRSVHSQKWFCPDPKCLECRISVCSSLESSKDWSVAPQRSPIHACEHTVINRTAHGHATQSLTTTTKLGVWNCWSCSQTAVLLSEDQLKDSILWIANLRKCWTDDTQLFDMTVLQRDFCLSQSIFPWAGTRRCCLLMGNLISNDLFEWILGLTKSENGRIGVTSWQYPSLQTKDFHKLFSRAPRADLQVSRNWWGTRRILFAMFSTSSTAGHFSKLDDSSNAITRNRFSPTFRLPVLEFYPPCHNPLQFLCLVSNIPENNHRQIFFSEKKIWPSQATTFTGETYHISCRDLSLPIKGRQIKQKASACTWIENV